MIEWTDEAIEAALRAYTASVTPDKHGIPSYDMRAALDAAMKAQGVKMDYATGLAHGRAEALEQAAVLRESLSRLLLEVDFMVERGVIPDVRGDIIYENARASLKETEAKNG